MRSDKGETSLRLLTVAVLFFCLVSFHPACWGAASQPRSAAQLAESRTVTRSPSIQFRLVGESNVFTRRIPIGGATAEIQGLLQSFRYGTDFRYVLENLPTDKKLYLELGFAELLARRPGERVFLVEANGRVLFDNLDIVAQAGGTQRALILRCELEPSSKLDLRFIGKHGDAIVNYVRVLGLGQEIILGPAAGRFLSSSLVAPYDLEKSRVVVSKESICPPHGMPLGGIGTGSFEILPDGSFSNFTIGNSWECPVTGLQGTFIVVRAKHRSFAGEARLLRAGKHSSPYSNIKPMEASSYSARFPCAELEFFDSSFPLDVRVQAVAPVVPYDLTLSGVPGALVLVEVSNPNNYPVASGVALSWEDFIGRGGSGEPGDIFGQAALLVHNDAGSAELMGVHLSSLEPQLGRRGSFLGDQFVGAVTTGVVVTRLLHWDPSTPTIPWLKEFIRSGRLTPRRERPEYWSTSQGRSGTSAAVVAAAFNLAPKEIRRIPFVVAWYYPHFLERGSSQSRTASYVDRFASSVGAAFYLTSEINDLLSKVSSWHAELYDCDLPPWLRHCLLNSAARCVANSVWWRGEPVRWWRSTDSGKGMLVDDLMAMAPEAWFHRFFGELAPPVAPPDGAADSFHLALAEEVGTPAVQDSSADLLDVQSARNLRLWKWVEESTTHPLKPERVISSSAELFKKSGEAAVSRAEPSGTVFADWPTTITGDLRVYKLLWLTAAAQARAALAAGSEAEPDGTVYAALARELTQQALRQLEELESSWAREGAEGAPSFAAIFAADYAFHETRGKGLLDGRFNDFVRSLVIRHLPADTVVPLEFPAQRGAISTPLVLNPWLAAVAIERGYANAGFEIAARQARLTAHPQNNPWGPAFYVDVGTAQPLGGFNDVAAIGVWAVLDAVVGVRYDQARESLRVVPRLPFEIGDHVFLPVLTPYFHGRLEYDSHEGEWKLSVYRIKRRDGVAGIRLRHVVTADPDYPGGLREITLPVPLILEVGQELLYRAGHCQVE